MQAWTIVWILALVTQVSHPSVAVAVALRNSALTTHAQQDQQIMQQNFADGSTITKLGRETTNDETNKGDLDDVEDDILNKYNSLPLAAQYILAGFGLIFGLFLTFSGYKFFRTSVFIISGFVIGVLVYGVLNDAIADDYENRESYIWGFSIGIGVFAGIFFYCFIHAGIFFLGASVGVMVAIMLNPIILREVWPAEPVINLYIWMAVFGLLFGVFVLCIERPLMIVSTSLAGSFLTVIAIGGFAGNFPEFTKFDSHQSVPWQWWAYFGGWVVLFVLGVLVQFLVTARDNDHKRAEYFNKL